LGIGGIGRNWNEANVPPLAGRVGVAWAGLVTQSAARSAGTGTGVAEERWRRVVRAVPMKRARKEGMVNLEEVVVDGGCGCRECFLGAESMPEELVDMKASYT
jgi:hypothetical protein